MIRELIILRWIKYEFEILSLNIVDVEFRNIYRKTTYRFILMCHQFVLTTIMYNDTQMTLSFISFNIFHIAVLFLSISFKLTENSI